jgi:Bifunctional DNA primase/polymerase, N-terminal
MAAPPRRPARLDGGGVMLGQALVYVSRGWPVFPCRPNADPCPARPPARCPCKAPVTPNGFLDASTDPEVIRAWWQRWPDANLAVATGVPGPDVLDVDVKPDGSGWAALNRLKRGGLLTGARMLVRTPRDGAHIYFHGTDQGCGALPRHHLDWKSRGGYVIAAPSRVHGRAYEVLDHRDGRASLDWQAVKRLLDPPRRAPFARPGTWAGRELPPGVQRALAADDTDRSKALHRLVGACVRAGMDEEAIRQLAGSYQPALEKYGARLPAEVERSLRRIGA